MKYKVLQNGANLTDVLNANTWPKRYRCEFIEPGICDYSDIDAGTIYIGPDTLDKMLSTFIGKPVVNELHNDLTPEQAYKLSNEDLESLADGVVYDVGSSGNGWQYCDMIIWDKKTQDNIDIHGYSVSCSYAVIRNGESGTHHAIPYDTEVLEGCYTHNAIVNKPRYERAKIWELPSSLYNSVGDELISKINNSRGDKEMFKKISTHLFNGAKKDNSASNAPEKKEDVVSMENAVIVLENGTSIPLNDAIEAYNKVNNMKEESTKDPDSAEKKDNAEEDDKKDDKKDNAEAPQDVVAEPVVKNACDGEDDKKDNAEAPQDVVAEPVVKRENSKKEDKKHFIQVKNAVAKSEEVKTYVNTTADRYARGASRYGSKEAK